MNTDLASLLIDYSAVSLAKSGLISREELPHVYDIILAEVDSCDCSEEVEEFYSLCMMNGLQTINETVGAKLEDYSHYKTFELGFLALQAVEVTNADEYGSEFTDEEIDNFYY